MKGQERGVVIPPCLCPPNLSCRAFLLYATPRSSPSSRPFSTTRASTPALPAPTFFIGAPPPTPPPPPLELPPAPPPLPDRGLGPRPWDGLNAKGARDEVEEGVGAGLEDAIGDEEEWTNGEEVL